jgi:hypothetical protein
MSDLNAMGTFEKYVTGLSLLTPDQLKKCKNVQHTLRELGISKGLEEITVRLGLMTADKLGSVLADIRTKWQITIPRPVITETTPEADQALQDSLVQKSPQGATQVIECRQIQEQAAKLGIALKVADVLIAKGYHAPAGASASQGEPLTVKLSDATSDGTSDDITTDDLLPEAPLLVEEPPAASGPDPKRLSPAKKPLGAAPLKPSPALGAKHLPLPGTKQPSLPGAKYPAAGGLKGGLSAREQKAEETPKPKKPLPPKVTFWIGIGSAAVLFIAALVILVVKSGNVHDPAPEPVAVKAAPKAAPKKVGATDSYTTRIPADPTPAVPPPAAPKTDPAPVVPAPAANPDPAPKPLAKATEPDPAPAPKPEPDPVKEEPKADPAPQKPDPAPAPEPAKPAAPAPAPAPAAKPAPEGKGKPGDPTKEAREARAQALWDQAQKLEKDNKLTEAQDRLRELRSRYRSTRVYWDKFIEITDLINELGQKIAAAALVKTTYYKRPHMDSWWAFEFVPPEGWKGVPAQPNLVGEQDNDETFYKGRTYMMARYNSPYLDKLFISIYKTFACTGLDNLEDKVSGHLESRAKGLKEDGKAMPIVGKMQGVRKTYVSNAGDRMAVYYFYGDRKGIALAGIWRAGGEGWSSSTITTEGVTSTRKSKDVAVSEADFSGALKVFDQCAKTFWIYDAAARAGKRVDLKMGALCSDWNTLLSSKGNYVIEYATRQDFAKRAADEMEQIQALYRHVMPSQKPIPPCRIKIFDREEEFQAYSGAYGAAAYWSPMQEEIVGYRFEGDKLKLDSKEEFTIAEEKNPEDVTFKVLYHEGFHQYMHFFMGRARNIYVPSWLNEGMGDYFFGGDWNKGRSKFTIGINDWRIKTISKAVAKNEHVPLDKIFRYEQHDYYMNAGLCYAEGWSINYFFQMSDVAKKKGYNTIPQRMMDELKGSGNWEKASDKVFAGIDLKKMEEEWKQFVLGLPVPKDAKGADDDNK